MDRREFLSTTSAAVGLYLASATAQAAPARVERPNVIYLFSDEHRYQSMSFTELPQVHTPHLARMAREGFSFQQCISNYPVCSPYRGMLLSGRWPYQNGVIDNGIELPHGTQTVAHRFQEAGYRTGYIGKWHLGGERAEPFGFEHSLIWTGTNVHWDTSKYHPADGAPVQPKGYNATLMTDQGLDFIRAHKDERFFLTLSLNPPHSKFTDPPKEKLALYPKDSIPYRPNVRLDAAAEQTVMKNNGYPHYEGYHGHISAIDGEVGRVMALLEELDLVKNTVLVYGSDHGSMHGSQGLGGKRQCYEESIHVPLLVWQPGVIPPGSSTSALIGTIDMFPTLCGLAGLSVPGACQGQDFSPWVYEGHGPDPEHQFLMHIQKTNASSGDKHPAPIFRGVRTKTHTFAHGPGGYHRLYDNIADPYQMNDLSEKPEHQALRQQLAEATRGWLKKAEDPYELVL
ncbi:MAG: sulfatase-like hydrolase/transferase [Candidatus Hydrogenedentes bacterium]|nr:sulfatase-like hydrolase/transferase [Candidatus Hydrogenedentota bacterium]